MLFLKALCAQSNPDAPNLRNEKDNLLITNTHPILTVCTDLTPQVDCKFMILECSGLLVALDQHAADERVRLEDLRGLLLAAVAAAAEPSVPLDAGGALGERSGDVGVPADRRPILSSVQLAAGAESALSPGELHLYEAYQAQVERCVVYTQ